MRKSKRIPNPAATYRRWVIWVGIGGMVASLASWLQAFIEAGLGVNTIGYQRFSIAMFIIAILVTLFGVIANPDANNCEEIEL